MDTALLLEAHARVGSQILGARCVSIMIANRFDLYAHVQWMRAWHECQRDHRAVSILTTRI